MKRRSFIKALIGAAALVSVPLTAGSGRLKLADDHRYTERKSIITTGHHPKMLWPGLEKIWGQEYK